MDTTSADTDFGGEIAVWFIAGLTDDHLTRPAGLEYGDNLKIHIETLVTTWKPYSRCWCSNHDPNPERARSCPTCLGVGIKKPDVWLRWFESDLRRGDQRDAYHAISEWHYAIHKAAFTATFANHGVEPLLNQPIIKGWVSGLANVSVYRHLHKIDEQRTVSRSGDSTDRLSGTNKAETSERPL